MARSPLRTTQDRTQTSTTDSTNIMGRQLAVPVDPDEARAELLKQRQNLQGTRNMATDLYNTVNEVYTDLINAGRNQEAHDLKDAAERFARAGSRTGVSSDQRIAALGDLKNRMRVAGSLAESKIRASQIGQSLSILDRLKGIDQGALQMAMNDARREIGQTQTGTTTNTVTNIIRQREPRQRLSDRVRRSPVDMQARQQQFGVMRDQGQQFSDQMRMARFMDERQRNLQYNNPGFRQTGSAFNTARAGQVMAQGRMGYTPGFFRQEARPESRAYPNPFAQAQARAQSQQPAGPIFGLPYALPGGGFMMPRKPAKAGNDTSGR